MVKRPEFGAKTVKVLEGDKGEGLRGLGFVSGFLNCKQQVKEQIALPENCNLSCVKGHCLRG